MTMSTGSDCTWADFVLPTAQLAFQYAPPTFLDLDLPQESTHRDARTTSLTMT